MNERLSPYKEVGISSFPQIKRRKVKRLLLPKIGDILRNRSKKRKWFFGNQEKS